MLLALELADAGLIALPSEGEVGAPSPGIAVVDGDTVDTGRSAAARSRTDAPAGPQPLLVGDLHREHRRRLRPDELRTADLAWAHLHRLWKEIGHGVTSVILALPAGTDERRAGLILGVARSAGLPVDGLVEAPVAAARRPIRRTATRSTSISSSTGRSATRARTRAAQRRRSASPPISVCRGSSEIVADGGSPGSSSRRPASIPCTRPEASRRFSTSCRRSSPVSPPAARPRSR
jgi:hypothetical protein